VLVPPKLSYDALAVFPNMFLVGVAPPLNGEALIQLRFEIVML